MSVKNTLLDLNNFLFGQMERLDNPDLTPEELASEIKRADAMKDVGRTIVDNAGLMLKAYQINDERFDVERPVPRELIGDGHD